MSRDRPKAEEGWEQDWAGVLLVADALEGVRKIEL